MHYARRKSIVSDNPPHITYALLMFACQFRVKRVIYLTSWTQRSSEKVSWKTAALSLLHCNDYKLFNIDHKASEEFQVSKDSRARSSSHRGRENLNVTVSIRFLLHAHSLQLCCLRCSYSRYMKRWSRLRRECSHCRSHYWDKREAG